MRKFYCDTCRGVMTEGWQVRRGHQSSSGPIDTLHFNTPECMEEARIMPSQNSRISTHIEWVSSLG